MIGGREVLAFRGLMYNYPDGHPALHGIDLTIAEGERVGVIGPNGAGKSTLLLHLNGILRGEGEVRICGERVERKTLSSIRKRVGLVFQNPDDQLFSPTLFDDVAFGPQQAGEGGNGIAGTVARALEAVGLPGFEQRNAYHLSLGEKKRAALATILVTHPDLLALDEPTSGLDPRGRRELIALLSSLPMTQLIATHDLALVRELCDRVVVLHEGLVAADGDPADLLEDDHFLLDHGLA